MAVSTPSADRSIIFITALSGTGKTLTGDFLADYCGVHHVDGDNILHRAVTDRPEWEQVAGDITKALFEFWMKHEPCPEALWHPYLAILCSQVRDALSQHHQVAVTWVAYRREVRDYLRASLGKGLRFVRLHCDVDVLVKGSLARLEEGLQLSKFTVEQWWRSEEPAMQNCGGQRRYGDFGFESYKQMQLENALNGMVEFGTDEIDAQVVDVSSRDAAALLRVSTALGLTPRTEEIALETLKAINSSRVKTMFTEMAAPTAVSMARYTKPRGAPVDQWDALLDRERRLDKALTVKPRPKRSGPSTLELLGSCQPPRVYARVRPLLEHDSGHGHLEGLAVRTALSVGGASGSGASGTKPGAGACSEGADAGEPGAGSAQAEGKPAWVDVYQDGSTHQTLGGFDGLFGVDADNRRVFAAAVEPALTSVMRGSGVSIFCYGHSGTGKTHSMLGYPGEPGLFTQTAQDLLDRIQAVNSEVAQPSSSVDGPLLLHVRFVELYLGKVFDLLNDRKECALREDADGSLRIRSATDVGCDGQVLVRDQHSVAISTSDGLAALLLRGLEQRAVGASSVHDQSSRSHAHLEIEIVNPALVQAREAVMQAEALVHPVGKRVDELMVDLGLNGKLVEYCKDEAGHHMTAKCDVEGASMSMEEWFALHEQLLCAVMAAITEQKRLEAQLQQARSLEEQIQLRGPPCLCARVTLVDLAGNDFDKRDVNASHSLQQRKESNHINKDLLAVKECINGIALKKTKIPFRNSSLTRVLQKALLPPDHEGATTIMLATVSPDADAKVSTTNTLRYAQMLTGRTTEPQRADGARAKAGTLKPWQKAGKARMVDLK